jgi:putative exosortase-associated protein (TIGR04073 family)
MGYVLFLGGLLSLVAGHSTVYALGSTAGDKLTRGLANTIQGIFEVPRNISNTTETQGLLTGLTVGLGKGLGYGVLRTLVGLYEVVTFPIPVPAGYAPIIQPYAWNTGGMWL